MKGTETSARVNNIIVFLKIGVIAAFIILGWQYINPANHVPYIPENVSGVFGEFGWSGVLRGAAVVFLAYLGFDIVSCAAQETKNPKRAMPIGILGSLAACTVLYILFAHVMTGVANYTSFAGQDGLAPVATAIRQMGEADASGTIIPAYPWLNRAVIFAILFGYCSVILALLMGQSRVFMTMSQDGLLPKLFSEMNPKTRTPLRSNVVFMVVISVLSAFAPPQIAGELTNIGTLFAFTIVCAGVLVVRRTMPDAERGFRTPFVPFVPLAGILVCVALMLFLPADTWMRLVMWLLIGYDIYSLYGMKHSKMAPTDHRTRRGQTVFNIICIGLGVLCIVTGFWHQQTVGMNADKSLLIIASVFGLLHIAWYTLRLTRKAN